MKCASLVSLLGGLALAACNSTTAMKVPKPAPQPASSAARVEAGESRATFALDRLVNGIGRSETIFVFPNQFESTELLCNYPLRGDQTITYAGGRRYLGDWPNEMRGAFYDEMSSRGYELTGDPSAVFASAQTSGAAEYLIAGRLTGMQGNMCHAYDWFTGQLLDRFGGEMVIDVEWTVLNTLTNTIALQATHKGYFKQVPAVKDGVFITFESAFLDSAAKLAGSDAMLRLAKGRDAAARTAQAKATAGAPKEKVAVRAGPPPGRFDAAALADSVVTVRVGGGHGAGFFIGRDGYLLTNAHVVGAAKRARVRTGRGLEVNAEVVRTDDVRDVALLRADIALPRALAIEPTPPAVASTVYAVGSPLDEALAMTVTRGIVSGLRRDARSGLGFIQADAAISPGNSGGPLFDDQGQVIGVAVSKLTGGGAEGLNLFIPIGEALQSVGVAARRDGEGAS